MAFQVPTLSDVSRTIENGFSQAFYGTSGTLRVGVLKVLSKVVAGGCYLPILFCQYIFKNSFIDTCDVDNLVRFGGWYNLPHKVASPARGQIYITFTKSGVVPVGTIVVDSITGDEYETLEDVSCVTDTTKTINVKVVASEIGSGSNRGYGVSLKFRDIEVDAVSVVKSYEISGGSLYEVSVNGVSEKWGESVESYRKRLKFRRQNQPMGGADADYKQWAERFSQVTDAYVFGNFPSTNSVCVFCADYNYEGLSVSTSNLVEVENYICSESRKPATADVKVRPVDAVDMKVTIGVSSLGGNIRQQIVKALCENLKGFGFGSTLTANRIKSILVENGVVSSCSVTKMVVNGTDSLNNGYEFKLTSGQSTGIVGELLNVNTIDKNLTLVTI